MLKGQKAKKTILKGARGRLSSLQDDEYLDAMVVLQDAMTHHYVKAARIKAVDENSPEVDKHLQWAAHYAVDIMPYRHHKLAAIKLDKDPVIGGLHENASLAELEAEMQKHWLRLAPILDLEALVAPSDGVANRQVPQDGAAGDARE